MICHKVPTVCKGVSVPYAVFGDAEVVPVAAALRAVHSAPYSPVAVVQDFRRQAGEHRTPGGLENIAWNGGRILAKVHHQRLSGSKRDSFPVFYGVLYDNLSVFFFFFGLGFHFARHTFPDISLHRLHCQVLTQVNLCPGGGENLPLELLVYNGLLQGFQALITGLFTGVEFFPVEN